jgi:CTP synthase (UTP-ammonia lyase)
VIAIGLIGDHDESVPAHRAIPLALQRAAQETSLRVRHEWVPTESIASPSRVEAFDGLWCVPASPYRSMEGALLAIRHARERRVPFLGTCGGFQHAVVEYARNVLGWSDAEHAETAPEAARPLIVPLACALVEVTDRVRLRPGSRIAAAYGASEATEGYRCRYGLSEAFRAALVAGALRIGGEDDAGDIRALELEGHPFFVATLFQPERSALAGRLPPLVAAFARAATAQAAARTPPSAALAPPQA